MRLTYNNFESWDDSTERAWHNILLSELTTTEFGNTINVYNPVVSMIEMQALEKETSSVHIHGRLQTADHIPYSKPVKICLLSVASLCSQPSVYKSELSSCSQIRYSWEMRVVYT